MQAEAVVAGDQVLPAAETQVGEVLRTLAVMTGIRRIGMIRVGARKAVGETTTGAEPARTVAEDGDKAAIAVVVMAIMTITAMDME